LVAARPLRLGRTGRAGADDSNHDTSLRTMLERATASRSQFPRLLPTPMGSAKLARLLAAAGLLLVFLVTCAVAYGLSPIFVAAASAVTGWVIAERNVFMDGAATAHPRLCLQLVFLYK
jgi:hypothetical protein